MVKNYCRLSFYTTESPIIKQNFLKQIRSTFGAGGFVCYLTEKELSEFHQHLERNFPFQHQDRVKKGVITLCRETARHQCVGAKQAPTCTYMKIGYRVSPSMPGNPLAGQALSLQARVCHTPALTCSATYDCHFNHLDHCTTFCSWCRLCSNTTLYPVEGFAVGQHLLVVKLLKGAYIQWPPKHRYSQTWDVTQMLAHLRSPGGNETLSLKLLILKLAMQLALVLGHWSSDLVRLTLCGRSYIPEGVMLPCKGLAKQTRPGNEKSL